MEEITKPQLHPARFSTGRPRVHERVHIVYLELYLNCGWSRSEKGNLSKSIQGMVFALAEAD
jgi:hypothetical protein